jgi:hypothetical protein
MTWRQFKRHLILKKPTPHCLPWSGSEWLRKFCKMIASVIGTTNMSRSRACSRYSYTAA